MNPNTHCWRPTHCSAFLLIIFLVSVTGFARTANAAPTARQATLMLNNCMQCHARPDTGAPFVGVADEWQEAVARGEDAMLVNVVQGIRGMPPLGYCSACSEEDLRVLIRTLSGMPDAVGEAQ
ncbi:MAG: cytochrome c5 [Halioglobus sp.]|jgi:cytochrome c5